jgi:hypothetical protein
VIQPPVEPKPGFPVDIDEEAKDKTVDLVEDDAADAGYKHEKLFVVGYDRKNLDN